MATLELEQAAQEHYAEQQSLVQRITDLILQLGRALSWDEVRAWFAGPSQVLYDAMVEAQAAAAAQGAAYVGTALAAAGVASEAVAAVVPGSLAGIASDGRDLASLLAWPIRRGSLLVERGAPPAEVTPRVIAELTMIARTQVADAGRGATGVAQVANRAVIGYVRMVELPACSRCIILAGRLYSWSEGFLRHPNCQCTHVPVSSLDEAGELGRSHHAFALFDQMSSAEQDRTFGRAGARAVRDGSDLRQVANARRGMYTADGRTFTTEGVTSRGIAGRRLGQLERQRGRRYRASRVLRLTPEQIYAEAGDDRDEALRLLNRFGYLGDGDYIRRRVESGWDPAVHAEADRAAFEAAVRPAAPEPERPAVPAAAQPYHRSLDGIEHLAGRVEDLDVTGTRRLGGDSAVTERLTLSDGSTVIRKQDRADREADVQSADSEQAASLVARALGLEAPAVYRPNDRDLYMEDVEGVTGGSVGSDRVAQALASDDGALIGLLDLMTMNIDRSSGNWLVTPGGRLAPIDHGGAYTSVSADLARDREYVDSRFADRFRDPDTDVLIPNPLTAADVAEIRARLEAQRADLAHLGHADWIDYSLRVLDELASHASGDRNLI